MTDDISTMQPATSDPAGLATPPLSQTQRVIYTFTAPSKTFTDILRSTNWLLPFVLMVLVSVGFSFAVQTKIGWAKAYGNQLRMNPKAQEKIDQMPADQQAAIRQVSVKATTISSYLGSLLALLFTAIFTVLIWATINFVFGGHGKFSQVFSVLMYTSLITYVLKYLLAILAIFAGLAPENFNLQNPVGTNLGYYLGTDSASWLTTLGAFIDVLGIWGLVLMTIGCAIVCKVKRSAAATAVVGWYVLFMLLLVGLAAARS